MLKLFISLIVFIAFSLFLVLIVLKLEEADIQYTLLGMSFCLFSMAALWWSIKKMIDMRWVINPSVSNILYLLTIIVASTILYIYPYPYVWIWSNIIMYMMIVLIILNLLVYKERKRIKKSD